MSKKILCPTDGSDHATLGVIRAAVACQSGMATFAEAGVSAG